MKQFQIRTYGLKELAQLYFPLSTPSSASRQLRYWMRIDKLKMKLEHVGYHSGQKILTPLQVQTIVEHVGEP